MKITKIGGGTKSGAKINWDKVYETIQFLEFDRVLKLQKINSYYSTQSVA